MSEDWIAKAIEQHRKDTKGLPERILAIYDSKTTAAQTTKTTAVNAVGAIIVQIKTDEDSVLAKLSSLQAAGAPNLGPVIAQLQMIHDKAVVADTALSAAGAPPPVVTPVPPVPPAAP